MSKHGTDIINLFFTSVFMNKYTAFLPLRLYPTLIMIIASLMGQYIAPNHSYTNCYMHFFCSLIKGIWSIKG